MLILTCALSHFSRVWLSVTPWTVAHHALVSMGSSRQEYCSGFPCLPPGDLPHLGIEPVSPASPALQADSLLLSHGRSPMLILTSLWLVFSPLSAIFFSKMLSIGLPWWSMVKNPPANVGITGLIPGSEDSTLHGAPKSMPITSEPVL